MGLDKLRPPDTAPIPQKLDEQDLVAWLRTQFPVEESLCNETLARISQLCWKAYEKGLNVCAGFKHNEDDQPVFLNTSETELLVDGMLYLDSARYALDIDRTRSALKSLDAAAPAGTRLSDHPIFEAAEAWCAVGEASRAARRGGASSPQDTRLPTPERVRAIAERASNKGYIKAIDWLTHTVMLLPQAHRATHESLQGLVSFWECMDEILSLQIEASGQATHYQNPYRRALVRAALGRTDEAILDLDLAITSTTKPTGMVFQDYLMQMRVLETEARLAERLQSANEQISSHTETAIEQVCEAQAQELNKATNHLRAAAEAQISAGMYRIVEILGLFMAIVGLLITTVGAAAFGTGTWWQRMLIVAAGSAGAVGFFATLRLVVKPR